MKKHFLNDNVDHNIRTLSEKGSFHVMGFICLITAKSLTSLFRTQVSKRKKVMKFSKICKDKAIQIKKYISSKTAGLSKLNFHKPTSLKSKTVAAQNSRIDYLWTVLSSSGNTTVLIG